MDVDRCQILGRTVQFEIQAVAMKSANFSEQRRALCGFLRRLLVNSVSAKESWFIVNRNHGQIKSEKLSHVADLFACSQMQGRIFLRSSVTSNEPSTDLLF